MSTKIAKFFEKHFLIHETHCQMVHKLVPCTIKFGSLHVRFCRQIFKRSYRLGVSIAII